MLRAEVLDTAKGYVTKDRQADHGKPEDTFAVIASMWTAYTRHPVTPVDVANMMALLKIARSKGNPRHEDNYVDMAGYAACAAELADALEERPTAV